MELAIVGALLVKENLPAKAACSLATLMESNARRRRTNIPRRSKWTAKRA